MQQSRSIDHDLLLLLCFTIKKESILKVALHKQWEDQND